MRLGVDSVDLIQLHCVPTEVMADGEIFDHLRQLKSEGLIKDFGASVESMEEASLIVEQPELTSLQIIFQSFSPQADRYVVRTSDSIQRRDHRPLATGERTACGKIHVRDDFRRCRPSQLQQRRRRVQCRRNVCGFAVRKRSRAGEPDQGICPGGDGDGAILTTLDPGSPGRDNGDHRGLLATAGTRKCSGIRFAATLRSNASPNCTVL